MDHKAPTLLAPGPKNQEGPDSCCSCHLGYSAVFSLKLSLFDLVVIYLFHFLGDLPAIAQLL